MIRSTLCLASLSLVSLSSQVLAAPLPLTKWETYQRNEDADTKDAADVLLKQILHDYADQGKRVFRDAHPRGIGCVAATFTVEPNLPSQYRTGVFAEPGKTYDAIIRFSGSLGPAADTVKDARGMAIKLFGVSGTKLLEDQSNAVTHDFLQINSPTFPAKNIHDFGGIAKIKSNPLSAIAFLREAPIAHALALKAVFDTSTGNPNNGKSLAQMQFFSMVPYLMKGSAINTPVKFASRPCSAVQATTLDGSDNELRNDLQARLNRGDLCYEFLYQFYRDGAGYDVENGMNNWGVDPSQFTKFATIIIPKQTFVTDQKLHYCDNLSFHPWHAVAEHQPLGNINRSRKSIYEIISKARHEANGESNRYTEPTSIDEFSSLKDPTYSTWDGIKIPASK